MEESFFEPKLFSLIYSLFLPVQASGVSACTIFLNLWKLPMNLIVVHDIRKIKSHIHKFP